MGQKHSVVWCVVMVMSAKLVNRVESNFYTQPQAGSHHFTSAVWSCWWLACDCVWEAEKHHRSSSCDDRWLLSMLLGSVHSSPSSKPLHFRTSMHAASQCAPVLISFRLCVSWLCLCKLISLLISSLSVLQEGLGFHHMWGFSPAMDVIDVMQPWIFMRRYEAICFPNPFFHYTTIHNLKPISDLTQSSLSTPGSILNRKSSGREGVGRKGLLMHDTFCLYWCCFFYCFSTWLLCLSMNQEKEIPNEYTTIQ